VKALVALVAFVVPGLAFAQAPVNISELNGLPYNANSAAFYESTGSSRRDTPTMAHYRLQRALALKAEAAELLEADGGTFTREHETYIRRKARDILGY
jgi:hypothetical protein